MATKAARAPAQKGPAKAVAKVSEAVRREIEYHSEDAPGNVQAALAAHEGYSFVAEDDGTSVLRTNIDGCAVEVRFDAAEVAAALYSSDPEDPSDNTESATDGEDFGDYSEPETMPFGVTLDVVRPSAPDRTLRLQLDVSPESSESESASGSDAPSEVVTASDASSYSVYLADATIVAPGGKALPGPALDSMDSDVRDALSEYARGLIVRVLPALTEAAVAADGAAYRAWLSDVKRVFD